MHANYRSPFSLPARGLRTRTVICGSRDSRAGKTISSDQQQLARATSAAAGALRPFIFCPRPARPASSGSAEGLSAGVGRGPGFDSSPPLPIEDRRRRKQGPRQAGLERLHNDNLAGAREARADTPVPTLLERGALLPPEGAPRRGNSGQPQPPNLPRHPLNALSTLPRPRGDGG